MNIYGKVVKGLGGLYEVETEDGKERISCRARGAFRHDDTKILIGDNVYVERDGEGSVISELQPRKNSLIRPPLANLDIIFTVVATAKPAPVLETLDKLIVIAEHNGIKVVPIFTKTDIESAEEYERIYKDAGYDVFSVSSETKEGIDVLREYIKDTVTDGKCAAFAGASGVGKSTLLNAIFPTLSLATGNISEKISRGKHTTRHVEIFRINEKDGVCGYLADTPGFSLLDFVRFDFLSLDDLLPCFTEFSRYAGKCRYSDCTHTNEREGECEIVAAVKRGEVAKSRHECYKNLYSILKTKKNTQFSKKGIDK